MKKLILLLLISGGLSAQVVVPKSTTTFSNVNAVGSMTVGGNLRVTGAETITGQAKLSNTLNIIGNTTINSNQTTTLTTGNTGTVAVKSDIPFSQTFNIPTGGNPADASTYYFGNMLIGYSTVATSGTIAIPTNCTLFGYTINNQVGGTLGSAETATVYCRVNNTTDVTLSTNVSFTGVQNGVSSSVLSTNLTAGDFINIKLLTPTWVTNPTIVLFGITLWFKVL